jgi:hypothetical protein
MDYNRVCTTCLVEKDSFSEFYESKTGYLGYDSVCKDCTKALSTERSRLKQQLAKEIAVKTLTKSFAQFLAHISPHLAPDDCAIIGEELAQLLLQQSGQKRLAKMIEAINTRISSIS